VPIPGLAGGASLKPQQYPVVRFALEHRRVLIGDDMGWGKTLSSLAAVAADRAYPAVVVCRPSQTLNWAGEIRRFFPGLALWEASGVSPRQRAISQLRSEGLVETVIGRGGKRQRAQAGAPFQDAEAAPPPAHASVEEYGFDQVAVANAHQGIRAELVR
jgi:hypothetical protein